MSFSRSPVLSAVLWLLDCDSSQVHIFNRFFRAFKIHSASIDEYCCWKTTATHVYITVNSRLRMPSYHQAKCNMLPDWPTCISRVYLLAISIWHLRWQVTRPTSGVTNEIRLIWTGMKYITNWLCSNDCVWVNPVYVYPEFDASDRPIWGITAEGSIIHRPCIYTGNWGS